MNSNTNKIVENENDRVDEFAKKNEEDHKKELEEYEYESYGVEPQ